MPDVTITIGPAHHQLVVDAVARRNGYKAQIQDPANPAATIPNPETRAQFLKRWIVNMLRQEVLLDDTQERQRRAQVDAVANAPVLDLT
jgi:hypothetical protein